MRISTAKLLLKDFSELTVPLSLDLEVLRTNEVRHHLLYRCIDRRIRLPSRITFDRAVSVTNGIMANS